MGAPEPGAHRLRKCVPRRGHGACCFLRQGTDAPASCVTAWLSSVVWLPPWGERALPTSELSRRHRCRHLRNPRAQGAEGQRAPKAPGRSTSMWPELPSGSWLCRDKVLPEGSLQGSPSARSSLGCGWASSDPPPPTRSEATPAFQHYTRELGERGCSPRHLCLQKQRLSGAITRSLSHAWPAAGQVRSACKSSPLSDSRGLPVLLLASRAQLTEHPCVRHQGWVHGTPGPSFPEESASLCTLPLSHAQET